MSGPARKIIVESAPRVAPQFGGGEAREHLDRVAEAVARLGHAVVRWPSGTTLPLGGATDVVWWGNEIHPGLVQCALGRNIRPLYVELGWLADRGTALQIDRAGCNGLASWAEQPLDPALVPRSVVGPPAVRETGPLLVCLRYEGSPQRRAAETSPWFRTNIEWVRALLHAPLPLRLRAHHKTWPQFTNALGAVFGERVEWSHAAALEDDLATARAVAVIDSTAGAQALERGLPVLCFGRQVFRAPGAVYCLTDNAAALQACGAELADGRCSLDAAIMEATVTRMRRKQWSVAAAAEWPTRLRREFGL